MIIKNVKLCESINKIRLNLLTFGYAKVGTEWSGKIINPIYSRLYYVIDGNATIKFYDGSILQMEKGNWYLLPVSKSFDYACDKMLEHVFFHLKLCDYDELDLLGSFNTYAKLDVNFFPDNFFIDYIDTTKTVDYLTVYNSVLHILLTLIDKNSVDIERKDFSNSIIKAIQYIRRNLSAQLTVGQIAENTFVSKSTLTKRFQKELGVSVNKYIYDMIMFEAGKMLMNTDFSIQQISEHFCFSDQFYFSKKFKEKFGVSPREFRKNTP